MEIRRTLQGLSCRRTDPETVAAVAWSTPAKGPSPRTEVSFNAPTCMLMIHEHTNGSVFDDLVCTSITEEWSKDVAPQEYF